MKNSHQLHISHGFPTTPDVGRARRILAAIVLAVGAGLSGCGGSGGGGSSPPSSPVVSISVAPADQTVIAGQTATFNVGANSSSALSYQWQKNGTDIPGATSSAYLTPVVDVSADNAQFSVR